MTASRSSCPTMPAAFWAVSRPAQPVIARFAVKPTSSILTPRQSIDVDGNNVDVMTKGRHDPCVGIRAVPIGEAMVACAIADHYLRHRGQTGVGSRSWATSVDAALLVPYCLLPTAQSRSEHHALRPEENRRSHARLRSRRNRRRHGRRRPRERRRPDRRSRPLHARENGLHRTPHIGHRVRANAARGGQASQPRAYGRGERRAAQHRLHRQRRLQARHHHRHFGRRPHADRAQPRQWQCRRLRLRASRPYLPAGRPRGRRADALRPYGGRCRPLQARRPAAGRRHLRTGQRRRFGDARSAGDGIRARSTASSRSRSPTSSPTASARKR